VKMKKLCSLLMAGWMLIGLLIGCGTLPGMEETNLPEMEELPTILTHVYSGEDFDTGGSYPGLYIGMMNECLLFQQTKTETRDGREVVIPGYLSVTMDGGPHTQTWLDLELDPDTKLGEFELFVFDGGCSVVIKEEVNPGSFAAILTLYVLLDDGTRYTREEMTGFSIGVSQAFRDTDGYVYLEDRELSSVHVLSPDLSEINTVRHNSMVYNLMADSTGTVYGVYYHSDNDGSGPMIAPIDPVNQQMGTPIGPVCQRPDKTPNFGSFCFGPDDTLYFRTSGGIYKYHPEDGATELMMHFENSMLTGEVISTYVPCGEERFLIIYSVPDETDEKTGFTTTKLIAQMFTHAPDIDLTNISTLELAVLNYNYNLPSWISNFNKTNPSVRVVTKDYYRYNTSETPTGGSTRLAHDILNGLYVPDMVFGIHTEPGYLMILENDLFYDLNTFLETDELLPRSDILGCVQRAYSKDGQMYAMPLSVALRAVLVNREMVGDQDGWTADEMLNFIRNLPEGVSYMRDLTQSNAVEKLFGPIGYSAFMDTATNTCSFNSDTFISLLKYIKSLPRTISTVDEDGHFGPYRTGKYAAVEIYYEIVPDFFKDITYFGENNVAYIGYPTASGENGILLEAEHRDAYSFIILRDTESPEHCWKFVRDTLCSVSKKILGFDLSVLRSTLQKRVDMMVGYSVNIRLSGGGVGMSSQQPDVKESNRIYYTFTEADAERIFDVLDTVGFSLISSMVPNDVTAIINEELSAYLGSDKSAEACADMIQSRVSIYLAEHS